MGYYTSFELTAFRGPDPTREDSDPSSYYLDFANKFHQITGYHIDSLCDIKWYIWEEDMIKLSKFYPETIFLLEGQGEDPKDLWKAYFHNGTCSISEAQIVFDPINPAILSNYNATYPEHSI